MLHTRLYRDKPSNHSPTCCTTCVDFCQKARASGHDFNIATEPILTPLRSARQAGHFSTSCRPSCTAISRANIHLLLSHYRRWQTTNTDDCYNALRLSAQSQLLGGGGADMVERRFCDSC